MARTPITVQEAKGPYPGTVGAGDLTLTKTAADIANQNDFAAQGRELIIAHNTGVTPHTITITSANTRFKRTADILTYSIAADAIAHFWIGKLEGWRQTGGKVHFEADDAEVEFAIVRCP
ncbi:hypothetical protein LCGC14_1786240 [marine sediment metagenome]|uniref:Uncharacterized protein n=1 Tax=marine sediment metagenome TaxID=412755 RepID=A0A0F9GTZ4_9ZZZZ